MLVARCSRGAIMIESSDFRTATIPLNHGAGDMPVLGFGTLIPDAARDDKCYQRRAGKLDFDTSIVRNDTGTSVRWARLCRQDLPPEVSRVKTSSLPQSCGIPSNRPERVEPASRRVWTDSGSTIWIYTSFNTPFAFHHRGTSRIPRDQNGNVVCLYDPGVTLLDTWRAMESLVDHGQMPCHRIVGYWLERTVAPLRICKNQASCGPSRSTSVPAGNGASGILQGEGRCVFGFRAIGSRIRPGPLEDPVISAIAARVGKTPAQVLLAWAVQRGTALLTTPKTAARAREEISTSPPFRKTRLTKSIAFRQDRDSMK